MVNSRGEGSFVGRTGRGFLGDSDHRNQPCVSARAYVGLPTNPLPPSVPVRAVKEEAGGPPSSLKGAKHLLQVKIDYIRSG